VGVVVATDPFGEMRVGGGGGWTVKLTALHQSPGPAALRPSTAHVYPPRASGVVGVTEHVPAAQTVVSYQFS